MNICRKQLTKGGKKSTIYINSLCINLIQQRKQSDLYWFSSQHILSITHQRNFWTPLNCCKSWLLVLAWCLKSGPGQLEKSTEKPLHQFAEKKLKMYSNSLTNNKKDNYHILYSDFVLSYLLFESLVMLLAARKSFDECCNLFYVPLGYIWTSQFVNTRQKFYMLLPAQRDIREWRGGHGRLEHRVMNSIL